MVPEKGAAPEAQSSPGTQGALEAAATEATDTKGHQLVTDFTHLFKDRCEANWLEWPTGHLYHMKE